MHYPTPPDRHYRYSTDPAELARLFTDEAERLRREDFNKRWGLPFGSIITDNAVRASSILIQEGHHLIQNYPRNRLIFITLTFKSRQQAEKVSKAFNDINRRVLPSFIEAWIKVVDVHENGRDHIHALGVTKGNILTHTDLTRVREFLDRVKAADNANGKLRWSERRKLRNATSANIHLAFLWAELDFKLPKLGFGWVYDAFPVIKPTSVPGYLRSAFLRGRWHDARHGVKNSRRVAYSKHLKRKFPGGKVPRSDRSIRNEAALLAAFGLTHRSEFREIIGKKWGYIILKKLPETLGYREPLDLFTPADLARRILTLCKDNLYFRSRLDGLLMNLVRVVLKGSR